MIDFSREKRLVIVSKLHNNVRFEEYVWERKQKQKTSYSLYLFFVREKKNRNKKEETINR